MKQKFILAICIVILLSLCSCTTANKVTDISEYLQINSSGFLKLTIFPENFDNISKINEYYHCTYDGFFNEQAEIYFDVCYDKDEFYEEIERLESISYKMKESHEPKSVIKDEAVLFNYTTYISVFNEAGDFEYVCVDETEYRMVYIALDAISDRISIAPKYMPKNYNHMYEEPENYKQYFSYNMYNTNPWDQ